MRLMAVALAFGLAVVAGTDAVAQEKPYPSKQITLVVPVAPGGVLDAFSRIVADKLKDRVGQPVVIENKPGNSSQIGAEYVARAAPDGYMLLGLLGSNLIPSLVKQLHVDMVRDFDPVTVFFETQVVMAVSATVPARTLDEFIAYAKANPGKINYGYASTNVTLITELVAKRFGLQLVGVRYRGEAPVAAAIQSGEIQFHIGTPVPYRGVPKERAVVLATMGKARSPMLPEVPTTEELGHPGFDMRFGVGYWVPKGTPKEIVERLNRDMTAIAAMAEIRDRVENVLGGRIVASSPADMIKQYEEEVAVYNEAAKLINFQPE